MVDATAARYERALRDLSENLVRAEGLADLLDYFARLLRGCAPDAVGPPLELHPSASQLRRALLQRARALDAARAAWEALPTELQEGRPSPEDVLEGVESC